MASKKSQEGIMRGAPPVVPHGAPLYRVTGTTHFINGRLVYPDQGADSEVRYAGIPGASLEPLDDAAKKARKEADAERAKRKAEAEQHDQDLARARALLRG
jgi:hypothetical protein